MNKKVLLVGRNPTVLSNLASALIDEGLAVKTTSAVEKAIEDFDGADFNLVAFGRGVDDETNSRIRTSFSAQNPNLIFVNGLAPVIPLLVRQISIALSDGQYEKKLTEFICLQANCSQVKVTVSDSCWLTIDLYELDAVHHTYQQTLIAEPVTAGTHLFSIALSLTNGIGIRFLAAQVDDRDLLFYRFNKAYQAYRKEPYTSW